MKSLITLLLKSMGAPWGTQKNKPETSTSTLPKASVRRIQGSTRWYEATKGLRGVKHQFDCGVLTDVTFNPKAQVMKDIFCGTDKVSEADATGYLTTFTRHSGIVMPPDAVRRFHVAYDPKKKAFHEKGKPSNVFNKADYLLLYYDGSSEVGYKTAA